MKFSVAKNLGRAKNILPVMQKKILRRHTCTYTLQGIPMPQKFLLNIAQVFVSIILLRLFYELFDSFLKIFNRLLIAVINRVNNTMLHMIF